MVVGSIATTILPFATSSRVGSGGLTWLLSSESEEEAEACLDLLLHEPNEALISALLVLLRAKEETYEEVSCRVGEGNAETRNEGRERVWTMWLTSWEPEGTVPTTRSTFRLVLRFSLRLAVAELQRSVCRGKRLSSSACGSADVVLEALGVVMDLGPQVS
ncbi:hypothetical protein JHK86_010666 [Glycine max]|nr:hypothetical protein JHK86_010666 [Glycine max]